MKKGFVFIETIMMLAVLSITVIGIYGMYIRVTTDIESRKYFDNIDDLYITNVVRTMIIEKNSTTTTTTNQVTNEEGEEVTETIENTVFNDPFISLTGNYLVIDNTNCTSYVSDNCVNDFSTLEIEKVYINLVSISELLENEDLNNNSLESYLKTINKNNNFRYIIVNYKYGNKNYYASLKI